MQSYLNVIALAILQGVAEFLPISSSGHLVIAERLLDCNQPGMRMEIMLHFGTLAAVCVYYRMRLLELLRGVLRRERAALVMIGLLLLATLPAVAFYGLAGERLAVLYESPRFTAWMLMVTGVMLLTHMPRRRRDAKAAAPAAEQPAFRPVNAWRALGIGVAQAFAVLPGISRSGATIVTARHLGVSPQQAAEFSFLMSIAPLMGGALLQMCEPGAAATPGTGWGLVLLGAAIAGVVGYFSIVVLMRLLTGGRFWLFGIYCLLAGGILLAAGI